MNDLMIIAPTQKVLDVLWESMQKQRSSGKIYIKLIGRDLPTQVPASFILIDDVAELKDKPLKVLCCSEEAIYWLSNNVGAKWELQFASSYFSMLDKLAFKEFAMQHRLPICPYWESANEVTVFPAIGKPSIGFASMGVQYLIDAEACQAYEDDFQANMRASVVENYRLEYFPNMENKPVFEQALEGDFYRTSFVVQKQRCTECFPVKGITQSSSSKRKYNWIEFEYVHHKDSVYMDTMRILQEAIAVYGLADGVYVAEFIVLPTGELYLLELSPRITSSRIAQLIQYSTGVDLEVGMVYLFLGLDFHMDPVVGHRGRLRIERKDETFAPLSNDYMLLPVNVETSAHGDSIECKYYIKKDE